MAATGQAVPSILSCIVETGKALKPDPECLALARTSDDIIQSRVGQACEDSACVICPSELSLAVQYLES